MNAKLRHFILGLGVIGAMALCPTAARADLEVTASVNIRATTDFHAPLAPYGTWIEVGSYGRCWRPTGVIVGWRPYCEGTWVWTDCGWYWQSDEPWGWACYHYGSWFEAPGHGWVWVPDVVWAPAWVTWRYGGGYCGWSPAPPHGVVLAPVAFVFVETHRFHEPIRHSRVIVNNTTVINRTTVIGGTVREERNISGQRAQNVVVNKGPDVAEVSRATGKSTLATAVPIREVARKADPPDKVVRQIKQVQEQKVRRAESTVPAGTTSTPSPAAPAQNVNPQPAPAPQPGSPQRPPSRVPPVEQPPQVTPAPAPAPVQPPAYQPQPLPPNQRGKPHPPPEGKTKGRDKDKQE